jgi:glycosyltransferase involved in cell wall biosynthesis
MISDAKSQAAIGIVAPIELAEFREYLRHGTLDAFPREILGATPVTPVNLLCKELLRRGRRLALFSLHPAVTSEYFFEGDRLRIYLGPVKASSVMNAFREERRFLTGRIARENLSCLHAHWTYEYALAASDTALPHVVTAHDAPINCLRQNFILLPDRRYVQKSYYRNARNNIFWIARTLVAYRAIRRAQRVVAVSPYLADHLRQYRFTTKPVDVIPNGIPEEYFSRRVRRRDDEQTITFATLLSNWSKLKNGASAIQAFAEVRATLPKATMMMFGPGYSPNGPAASWARQRGMEQGIEFMGHVPNPEIIRALSERIDVLVHPSLEEAYAMPLVEAMSMGIPAIGGSKSGAVPWTLGPGGLLVDVRSPRAIASAMLQIASDDVARMRLERSARESVMQRFHLARTTDQYEAIYSSLVTQGSRPIVANAAE